MIVVDASAVIEIVAYQAPEQLLLRLSAEPVLHAPHLLDVEVLSALRSGLLRKALTEEQADQARSLYGDLAIDRYPHQSLTEEIWNMHHNLSVYDATYVALAKELDATLVTTDARLANAPGLQVEIEVYEPSG